MKNATPDASSDEDDRRHRPQPAVPEREGEQDDLRRRPARSSRRAPAALAFRPVSDVLGEPDEVRRRRSPTRRTATSQAPYRRPGASSQTSARGRVSSRCSAGPGREREPGARRGQRDRQQDRGDRRPARRDARRPPSPPRPPRSCPTGTPTGCRRRPTRGRARRAIAPSAHARRRLAPDDDVDDHGDDDVERERHREVRPVRHRPDRPDEDPVEQRRGSRSGARCAA